MQKAEQGVASAGGWTHGLLALLALAIAACGLGGCQPADPQDAHAEVARKAAERMAGVRCIGARASAEQKDAIALLLAVNTLAPRGSLPAWLPGDYAMPASGPAASDTWNTLAEGCPNAPAFGTPFGFPSADIERELRADTAFAGLSDRRWAEIRRYQSKAIRQ
ncbi:hypothetical protein GT347_05790 [Xylophilus rhododendri]|uniref:Lipoprotein n=1 Tax=Xylophilus rhododendri TaxID=2697032 RepID=A0A857J2S7_9BURK|nr:hypothetical protein [Xylophilus rhododendri]QHI97543.1 hypothetical protein GT347_05790 [Xylophilus rhododendri]